MWKNHKRGVVKCAGKEGRGKGGSLVCAQRQAGDLQHGYAGLTLVSFWCWGSNQGLTHTKTELSVVLFKESGFPLGTSLCFIHFRQSSLYYFYDAVREWHLTELTGTGRIWH